MSAQAGPTAAGRAQEWLGPWLARHGGQASAGVVLLAGAAAGHSGRTVRRAAASLGVVMTRAGFGRGSTWALPAGTDTDHSGQRSCQGPDSGANGDAEQEATEPALEPVRSPAPLRVPSALDRFGRPTDYITVQSEEARGHWDARQWESGDGR